MVKDAEDFDNKGKTQIFRILFLFNEETAGKNQNNPIRRVTTGRKPCRGSADGTGRSHPPAGASLLVGEGFDQGFQVGDLGLQ